MLPNQVDLYYLGKKILLSVEILIAQVGKAELIESSEEKVYANPFTGKNYNTKVTKKQ